MPVGSAQQEGKRVGLRRWLWLAALLSCCGLGHAQTCKPLSENTAFTGAQSLPSARTQTDMNL